MFGEHGTVRSDGGDHDLIFAGASSVSLATVLAFGELRLASTRDARVRLH